MVADVFEDGRRGNMEVALGESRHPQYDGELASFGAVPDRYVDI